MNILKIIAVAFLMGLFCSCYMDTHVVTDEYYQWTFVGIGDNSTAIVKVEFIEAGHIDCHHFMGMDDGESFHRTLSTDFYEVRMDLLKMAKLPSPDNYLVENEKYKVDFIWLDENDRDCGFALLKNGVAKDTLEVGTCSSEATATIMGDYLHYNGKLYAVADGKILSHKPVYKVIHKDRKVIFEDVNGNQVIYGGEP